jgi:hypothetical protein
MVEMKIKNRKSLEIDTYFRMSVSKIAGKNARNRGVIFPRLCGVFTNVAANG